MKFEGRTRGAQEGGGAEEVSRGSGAQEEVGRKVRRW